MDREECCDYPPSYETAIAAQQELTPLEGSPSLIMAPPPGYYTAVMQLPATSAPDGDHSTSTSEEIEADIEVWLSSSCVMVDTIVSLSSTTD